jgi:hypothetical protein
MQEKEGAAAKIQSTEGQVSKMAMLRCVEGQSIFWKTSVFRKERLPLPIAAMLIVAREKWSAETESRRGCCLFVLVPIGLGQKATADDTPLRHMR